MLLLFFFGVAAVFLWLWYGLVDGITGTANGSDQRVGYVKCLGGGNIRSVLSALCPL